MTPTEKERILDIVWQAMSAAAAHDDIPMEAQIIADQLLPILDRIISRTPPSAE